MIATTCVLAFFVIFAGSFAAVLHEKPGAGPLTLIASWLLLFVVFSVALFGL